MNSMRVERVREIENDIAAPGNQRIRGRGLSVGTRLRRLRLRAIARRRSVVRLDKAEVGTLLWSDASRARLSGYKSSYPCAVAAGFKLRPFAMCYLHGSFAATVRQSVGLRVVY